MNAPIATSSGDAAAKVYILDTNVLLYDPRAIFSFKDNHIVIPIVVIDEIDSKKKDPLLGFNARETIRIIDQFRAQGLIISDGVNLPEGGTFRIEINNDRNIGDSAIGRLDLSKNDNRILLVAYNLSEKEKKENPDSPRRVVIVSNDGAVRIKAEAVGLRAEEYRTNSIKFDQLYTGYGEMQILPETVMDKLFEFNSTDHIISDSFPNQFFNVQSDSSKNKTVVRYLEGRIYAVNDFKTGRAFDLTARNPGQNCAIDLLMNEKIGMVSLIGKAGTGKTLLAIAAGLDMVSSGHCDRLVITRPTKSVGEPLGFLPGDIESKMDPWMRPIFDSIDFLMMNNSKRNGKFYQIGNDDSPTRKMILDGILEIQPLTYARGITLPNMTLIIDEAQNMTPHEIKTLATRVGEGSRIFLTGDPNQIDNTYVNKDTNGLTYFVDHIKGQPDYGHVTLTEGERSHIATICSELL